MISEDVERVLGTNKSGLMIGLLHTRGIDGRTTTGVSNHTISATLGGKLSVMTNVMEDNLNEEMKSETVQGMNATSRSAGMSEGRLMIGDEPKAIGGMKREGMDEGEKPIKKVVNGGNYRTIRGAGAVEALRIKEVIEIVGDNRNP
jgi:hypothetical protein